MYGSGPKGNVVVEEMLSIRYQSSLSFLVGQTRRVVLYPYSTWYFGGESSLGMAYGHVYRTCPIVRKFVKPIIRYL